MTAPKLFPAKPLPGLQRRTLLTGLPLAALLAVGGCSRSDKPNNKAKALARDQTLLCLGDSLTFGYGAGSGASYPQVLEQLTGYVTQNAGVNGDTAEAALARLPALMQNNTPALVLISVGGNDFLRQAPLERTRAALMSLVQTAAASAQVVLIAQPAPVMMAAATGRLKDHPLYAEVAAATGTALFENGWSDVLSREEWRSDPIHANTAGYAEFAGRLAKWLRSQGFLA